jgi:hypothetical protein
MVRKSTTATTKDIPEESIQILKEATCPTSSGKSTLGYQVGADESGEIFFKLVSNTGGGFFTSQFFSYSSVVETLESLPDGQPFSSFAMRSLIKNGASSNNAGFATALLVSEGILELAPGKTRLFQASEPSGFLDSVEQLRKKAGVTPAKKTAAKSKAKTQASPKTKAAPKKNPRKTR